MNPPRFLQVYTPKVSPSLLDVGLTPCATALNQELDATSTTLSSFSSTALGSRSCIRLGCTVCRAVEDCAPAAARLGAAGVRHSVMSEGMMLCHAP